MERQMTALKNSKTEETSKAAFAGESRANRRYLYFAQEADIRRVENGAEPVRGTPDQTHENNSPAGKASAVQFLQFPFTNRRIARFKTPGAAVTGDFDHPNYGHLALPPGPVRAGRGFRLTVAAGAAR
jgi:hypothetical protein